MAKSAWKFTFFSNEDLYCYARNLQIVKLKQTVNLNNRWKTINKWNYRNLYKVSQGKYKTTVRPTLYHISQKLGLFAKTRKPFFFRTKKKKR